LLFGAIISLALIYLNETLISLDLLFFSLESISIGQVILYAFLIGSFLTFFVEVLVFFKKKEKLND